MKKTIFLILIVNAFFIQPLYSQSDQYRTQRKRADSLQRVIDNLRVLLYQQDNSEEDHVLVYDFGRKRFMYNNKLLKKNNIRIKENELLRVKVTNINRYLYKVDFSADEIVFASEQPALFKQFFTGTEGFFSDLLAQSHKALLDIPAEESMNIVVDSKNNIDIVKEGEIFEKVLTEFMEEYYTLLDKQLESNFYCPGEIPNCSNQKSVEGLLLRFFKLKIAYQKYDEFLSMEVQYDQQEIEEQKKKLEKCKKDCDNIRNAIRLLEKRRAKTEIYQASLKKIWSSISSISSEELMKLTLFANNFVADHYTYVAPPVYPKSNKLEIGLKISPADSSLVKKWNIMPLYNDSLGLEILIKGKTRVSFSSGPFMVFGNSLRNQVYDWQAQPNGAGVVTDSSQYKIVAGGYGNVPLGLSAFAHIRCWQPITKFAVAISPGVGLTLEEKPRPVYFVGASFMFGEQNQFNVNGGLALAQTEQLRSDLYPDRDNTLYDSKSDILYRKTLNAGFFLSLSYTFYSLDRKKGQRGASKK